MGPYLAYEEGRCSPGSMHDKLKYILGCLKLEMSHLGKYPGLDLIIAKKIAQYNRPLDSLVVKI